jgi:hypothetical protein
VIEIFLWFFCTVIIWCIEAFWLSCTYPLWLLDVQLNFNYIRLLKNSLSCKKLARDLQCVSFSPGERTLGATKEFIILQLPSPRTSYSPCIMKSKALFFTLNYSNFDNDLTCTVRSESRCALIKNFHQWKTTVSKNWIKQLHTLPVLHFNRCLTT